MTIDRFHSNAEGRSRSRRARASAVCGRAAHSRRNFSGGDAKSGSESRATLRSFCGDLAAFLRAVEFRDIEGGLSCVMGIGSEAWDRLFGAPRPAELHPLSRDSLPGAPCGFHAGRLAVPHPREAHGFVLRAGDANHGAHRRCGFAGGRSARLPLLRRPRPDRFRRWDGEPEGRGGGRRRADRRGRRGVLPAEAT